MTDFRKVSTEQQGNAMNTSTELARYGDLLSQKELSERIGTKESTLAQWRYLGRGPKFVRLGRKIFYRQQDIDAYIDANVRQSTSS